MRALFTYTLVGAVATVTHYALLVFCVEVARWPAYAASGFGALIGAQVAYLGNRSLTFRHRGALGPSWLKFQATGGLGAALGMALVALGEWLGVHYLLAQLLATMLMLGLTFAINRRWTFR